MGRLFDEKGIPLVPTSTIKGGKRYRYYVSRDLQTGGDYEAAEHRGPRWRLSAHEIEKTVEKSVRSLFANSVSLARLARAAKVKENLLPELLSRAQRCDRDLLRFIRRVDLDEGQLTIEMALSELIKDLDATLRHAIPFERRKRGNEVRLVIAEDGSWVSDLPVDSVLIKAISRARVWFDDLSSGRSRSILEIAEAEAISDRYIGQLMPLAFLAPEVIAQIVAGSQPGSITTETLRRELDLPVSWIEQLSLLRLG